MRKERLGTMMRMSNETKRATYENMMLLANKLSLLVKEGRFLDELTHVEKTILVEGFEKYAQGQRPFTLAELAEKARAENWPETPPGQPSGAEEEV